MAQRGGFRVVTAGMVACALVGCSAGTGGSDDDTDALAPDPTQPGPYDVDRFPLQVTVPFNRDGLPTMIATGLYVPSTTTADDGGPLPVVVFSHGFAIAPDAYHETLIHLASWGFAVAAPVYDQGFLNTRTHQGLADDVRGVITWLQQNAVPDLDLQLGLSRFGVSGHSRGGKQSILAAIQESAEDGRIVEVFGVDPVDALPPFGDFDPADYPSVAPELMGGLTVPFGALGAGYGGEGVVPCAPVEDNYASYGASATTPGVEVALPTAGHSDFLDDCANGLGGTACTACKPGDDPAASAALARGLLVAWHTLHLKDDTQFEPWIDAIPAAFPGATLTRR
jgi:predicted dienelactone hydrolase